MTLAEFVRDLPQCKEERLKQFVDRCFTAKLGSRCRVAAGGKISIERLQGVLEASNVEFEEFLRQFDYFDELTTRFAEMEFFTRIAWHRVLMDRIEGYHTNNGMLHAIKSRAIDAFSVLAAAEILDIAPDGLLDYLEKEVSRNDGFVASIRKEPPFTSVVFLALAA